VSLKLEECPEKLRLLDVYQTVLRAHSEAVAQLYRAIGTTTKAEYNLLSQKAEELRLAASRAEQDLTDHVVDHGCSSASGGD